MARGAARPRAPTPARGRAGGGDGGGCGRATARPQPEPVPLAPRARGMEEEAAEAFELAGRLPGGWAHLSAHEAAEEVRLAPKPWQRYAHMLAATGQLERAPCWLAAKPMPRAYLPGCTVDECHGHTDRALAAALCDAYDGGCGGVTAMTEGGVTYYQTRAARETVRSPSNERTWRKTPCRDERHLDEGYLGEQYLDERYLDERYLDERYRRDNGGEDGMYSDGAGGPPGLTLVQDGRRINACASCVTVAADVLREVGARRRSEAEVVSALEGSCDRLRALGGDEAGATCWAVLEEHAEALEAALTTGKGVATERDASPQARDAGAQAALATRACAAAIPECGP